MCPCLEPVYTPGLHEDLEMSTDSLQTVGDDHVLAGVSSGWIYIYIYICMYFFFFLKASDLCNPIGTVGFDNWKRELHLLRVERNGNS